MKKLEFVAKENCELKKFLQSVGLDFLCVQKLFRKKDIKVNGKRVSKNIQIETGDKVECFVEDGKKDVFIERLFEDDNIVVVDKPCGVETCGENSVESALSAFAVNRLDRNTSGVMIFAKNLTTKTGLEKVFKNSLVEKYYLCEVVGNSHFDGKICKAYLFKDAKKSRVIVSDNLKPNYVEILTQFETVKVGDKSSLVLCKLLTGRTHQIRAHLAHLGYPVVGDNKYGSKATNKTFGASTQRLECVKLCFKDLKNEQCLTEEEKEKLKNISGRSFEKSSKLWEIL